LPFQNIPDDVGQAAGIDFQSDDIISQLPESLRDRPTPRKSIQCPFPTPAMPEVVPPLGPWTWGDPGL
jgi:hypothetical protein